MPDGQPEVIGLPGHFARNLPGQHAVGIELQEIAAGLGRDFPPEADIGDPAHRGLKPVGLIVPDGSALSRPLAIVRDVGLRKPAVGINAARRTPYHPGRIQGLLQGRRRSDIADLVHPRAIESAAGGSIILNIPPLQYIGAGRHRERTRFPVALDAVTLR